jgi:hypothetical protein
MKPPKWSSIYPQGTPEGDDEQLFFCAIIRDKYQFKTISQLALETGLSKERIEEIISKYSSLHMVIQNPKNEDAWGYWENCLDLIPKPYVSLAEKGRNKRIEEENKKE